MSEVCTWFDLTDGLGRKSLVIAEVQTLLQRGHTLTSTNLLMLLFIIVILMHAP